jgi:N-acetylmuramoyl-L-alanine amidase
VLALVATAAAQQRHNFLAVDGRLLDDVGPYYFIDHGDSSNAFAKAAPLAAAMDLDVTYDGDRGVLVFEDDRVRAELDVTRDVAAGLEHRLGALRVDGVPFGRPVPRGLLVDGTSYVALTPIVEAFGGSASWHQDARVIEVALPDRTVPDRAAPDRAEAGGVGGASATARPRIGRHDGYTRVALDLPHSVQPELLVSDGSLALVLPGTDVEGIDRRLDAGPLQRVYRDRVGGEDALVLVVEHAIDASGTGYRLGQVEGGVLYVDVGPQLRGDPAAGPAPEVATQAAAAVNPPQRQPTVVLDAGHGGHDPGTVSDWAREEEIVLDVTLRLADRLEAAGVEVILTRNDDEFLTLQERSTYATTERNVFVSVHANAAPSRQAQGIETWVFGRPLDPSLIERAVRENGGGEIGARRTAEAAASADDIVGDILREDQLNRSMGLAEHVQSRMVEATGATDRGVRQNLFYVIRNSRIPAILVELGFVSHPDEGRRLMRSDYRDALADALAEGILAFFANGGSGGELAQR